MATDILVDASFWVGALDAGDAWHARALVLHSALLESGATLHLTDLTVLETAGVLIRRGKTRADPSTAETALQKLWATFRFEDLEPVGSRLIALMPPAHRRMTASRSLNLLDAVLVEYMLEAGIFEIASFDKDFDGIAGITRLG